jgi:predicted RND superfamily exporter protein
MLVKVPDAGETKGKKRNIGRIVQSHIDPLLARMGHNVYRHRAGISIFFAALAVVSAIGFIRLRANDSWVEMFPHNSDVYISDRLICEKMNGTISLNIIVEGDEADVIKSPSVLKKMDGLQQLAKEFEQVGGVISIVEYIKRMNKVMNEGREEFNTIPDSKEAVAQYLLLYSLSGDPDDFDEVVDYNYRQANMTVMMKDDHTVLIKGLTDRLNRYIETEFGDEPVEVHVTGFAYIAQLVIDLAVRGMLESIIISILVIYAMTALMFRSFAGGFYNIIPITLAMLINFGLMGMLGITIGFDNSVSFAIAMGIGVDYAIHLIFKFQREINRTTDPSDATAITLQTSGKAILFNTAVVTAGFMLLLASSFTGHKIFGWLISLSMVTSFIGSVTLLPAALSLFKPSFVFQGKKDASSR